jgi:hypothetical protein
MTEQVSVYHQVGGIAGVAAVTERIFSTMRDRQGETPDLWRHFQPMSTDQLVRHMGMVAGALSSVLGADGQPPVTAERLVDWHRDVPITQEDLAAFGGITVQACRDLGAHAAVPVVESVVPLLQQTLVDKQV